MTIRTPLSALALMAVASLAVAACASPPAATSKTPTAKAADATEGAAVTTKPEDLKPLNRPAEHWKPFLSDQAFHVLFERGTERAFTSPLNDEHREGVFVCAACNLPVFTSDKKFDSGTGWPSFWAPIEGHLGFSKDNELIYERDEYHCIRCGGHMGHVFGDGPRPTGQRWCNNGVSLKFIPKGEALPALRS